MEKIRQDDRAVGEMAEGGELNRLRQRHEELERRLAELERHLSLTPDEQVEQKRLKKEKLRTKDELQRLGAVRAP